MLKMLIRVLFVTTALMAAACGTVATPEWSDEAQGTHPAVNAAAVPEGDPANGEALYNEMQAAAGFACSTCHFPNQETQLIGPGLLNISTRAETRVPDQSAYDYVHTSIVDPSAHLVEGFPDNLMPKVYGEIFTEEQVNDIIAYLFTLK